jgi:hypothetical protein
MRCSIPIRPLPPRIAILVAQGSVGGLRVAAGADVVDVAGVAGALHAVDVQLTPPAFDRNQKSAEYRLQLTISPNSSWVV